ncbi:MAG TPA: DUF3089 domain-containing protein [Gammaproteobacteria bacterium]|nr:DUF3089 domain-containing protein [Gammaproteobacteria bacterium]
MKKFLVITAVITGLLLVVGYVFRAPLTMIAAGWAMTPNLSFADDTRSPDPDYAMPNRWAALPDREDFADVIPDHLAADTLKAQPVDVFFIHPTTYTPGEHWNQPLDHTEANQRVDYWVMRDQASAFNGCCNVYAPRYRQANLAAFFDASMENNGQQALDLAYQDVASAFRYFIENFNDGRPFIIAGHSQGSFHGNRLLREQIIGPALGNRMIAAYTVGFPIEADARVDVCKTPTQTNCQISWNANEEDAAFSHGQPTSVCVNPLTWDSAEPSATEAANLGAITFAAGTSVEVAAVGASCENGQLILRGLQSESFSYFPFGPGNFHIYDYALFYMNIRQNLGERVSAYLAQAGEATLTK